eukprot:TRINITY_DN2515_c0_g1_i1.p1 TRINITY_DN2515_c0_g1~~TRINITY_DN2515_c0_g1_i1.p1  ORF type:complete len:1032 (-),score=281.11 TRINITY_DN2515_c0_g1_i1:56-2791(-)
MDFCEGGDVTAQIERAKAKGLPLVEDRVLRWTTQASMALKYLHDKKVLHRDLKPSNLFLTATGDLRMGDFGIAKVLDSTAAQAVSFVGTPYYISPEVIQEKPYSWPADVWSMGCILYQLCALQVPFDAKNIAGLAKKITSAPIPTIPSTYSEDLRHICSNMMRRRPDERPSIDDVVASPLIQDAVKKILAEKKDRASKTDSKAGGAGGGPPVAVDGNGDGAAERKREVGGVPAPKDVSQEVIDEFNRYDKNGDGAIDREELAHVLTHIDRDVWTDEQIDLMLQAADCNCDGRIQFDEFVRWIFGSDGEVGLAERTSQMIDLSLTAAKDRNFEVLYETLLRWRQAVDIGCLRLRGIESCRRSLDALAILARALPEQSDSADPDALEAARHMGSILDDCAQLLADASRSHVARVAAVVSRGCVRGLCFELADGTRLGQSPGGLTDAALSAVAAQWHELSAGDQIVEVRGHGAAPAPARHAPPAAGRGRRNSSPPPAGAGAGARGSSPPPGGASTPSLPEDCLAERVVLCCSSGRRLEFGSAAPQGPGFGFRMPAGRQIEAARFEGRTCVGVEDCPAPPRWPAAELQAARANLRAAAAAVCPALLRLSRSAGRAHARHALLLARQLGALSDTGGDGGSGAEVVPAAGAPAHWDISIMPGSDPAKWLEAGAKRSYLPEDELGAVQAMLTATFGASAATGRDVTRARAPCALELVRAQRLQHWRAWSTFTARSAELREQMRGTANASAGGHEDAEEPGAAAVRVKTECHHPMGLELETGDNCVWLYHPIGAVAAESVDSPAFSVESVAGDGERSRLYGRGVYLSELSGAADAESGESVGGLRCMLLCRVVLGRPLADSALLPDVPELYRQCLDGPYHSVIGRCEKPGTPSAPRRFVVYDADQVYPELLLWYKRVYK